MKNAGHTKSPRVSIIMPAFNRERLIGESIRSVLGQDFPDWELIVVDDGSTDQTAEVVKGFSDERIRYHYMPKTGLGVKLKWEGIKQARGEWIAFLDSDDGWAPGKLQKQIAAMEQYPAAAFSLTGGYNFRRPGEPLEYFYQQREGVRYGELLIPLFRSEVALLPQTLLLRRVCLPVLERFAETAPGSDVEFIYGLVAEFPGLILYEPLLSRRLHDTNISGQDWERGYREGIKMIKEYRDNRRLPAAEAKKAAFRLYINYGEKCIRYRKTGRAISCFRKAWWYQPGSIIPLKKSGKALLGLFSRKQVQ